VVWGLFVLFVGWVFCWLGFWNEKCHCEPQLGLRGQTRVGEGVLQLGRTVMRCLNEFKGIKLDWEKNKI